MKKSDRFDKIDILLVDDRPENLLSLEAVLACPDYNLIKASSGDEALRYLLDNTPALILMDVQMPDLDGFQTAAIIKSGTRTREIPIIFITAINSTEQFVHKGYDHGAVDYIYKPCDPHILKSKVAVFAEIRRQHGRVFRLVAVQQSATQALADSTNFGEAASKILKSICTSLGWDLGMFWLPDRKTNALRCEAQWHDPVQERPEICPDIGLPGRVWAGHQALWITPNGSHQNGFHTQVGIPICFQNETLGVLEFHSRKKMFEDPEFVKIMSAIGSQAGQYLKRTEAFELVLSNEARKAAILESSLDCIITMDHKGKIVEFNPASERTFGYGRAAVIGKKFAETLLVGEQPAPDKRTEVIALRSDGSEFPAELAIKRVSTVEPPLFTAFLRDITERKRAERNSSFLVDATAILSSSLAYEETLSCGIL